MGLKEVTLLIQFSVFPSSLLLLAPAFPLYSMQTCSADTPTKKSTFRAIIWNPQREVITGCPPADYTHKYIHTHTLLNPHILQESATKQKGRSRKKDRKKKKGGKDYRLAFRAPRGPLLSIRNESSKAPAVFPPPPLPPTPLSLQGPLSMKRAI